MFAVPNPAGPHEVARMPGSPLIDDKGVVGGIDGGVKAGAASIGKQVDAAQAAINEAMATAGKLNDEAVKGMANLEAGRNAYHAAMRLPDGPERRRQRENLPCFKCKKLPRESTTHAGRGRCRSGRSSRESTCPAGRMCRLASLGSSSGKIGKAVGRIATPLIS